MHPGMPALQSAEGTAFYATDEQLGISQMRVDKLDIIEAKIIKNGAM